MKGWDNLRWNRGVLIFNWHINVELSPDFPEPARYVLFYRWVKANGYPVMRGAL